MSSLANINSIDKHLLSIERCLHYVPDEMVSSVKALLCWMYTCLPKHFNNCPPIHCLNTIACEHISISPAINRWSAFQMLWPDPYMDCHSFSFNYFSFYSLVLASSCDCTPSYLLLIICSFCFMIVMETDLLEKVSRIDYCFSLWNVYQLKCVHVTFVFLERGSSAVEWSVLAQQAYSQIYYGKVLSAIFQLSNLVG